MIVGCPARGHSCDTYRRFYPRPPTRPARQMGVLSRENLRTAPHGQQGFTSRLLAFFDPHRSQQVYSGKHGHIDQLALVLEHVHLPDVYHAGFVAAKMGRSLQYQDFYTIPDRPAQFGRPSYEFWPWGERFAPSVVG